MSERLREQFERVEALLESSPERGRDTAVTRVRLQQGLACEIEEGPWKLVADMGRNVGGTESGPTPGVYGRAALGSCMAITYAMWAAKRGVPVDAIEIRIEADFDSGALFATADVPAGYSEVRAMVRIETNAEESAIQRVLDEADAHSPYVDVFTRGQTLTRSLQIVREP